MNSRNDKRPGGPGRTTTRAPEEAEPDLTIECADAAQVEQAAIRPPRILPDISVSLAAMRDIRIFDPAEALRRLREIHGNQYFESIRLETHGAIGGTSGRFSLGAEAMQGPALAAFGHTGTEALNQLTVAEQVKALREYADDDLIIAGQSEIKRDPNLKDEDILRSRRLHVLLEDARDGRRRPLTATTGMIAAIQGLRTFAPQFESVIGVVENAAAMSLVTGQPIQVPPMLLLGPPGIGKTFFAKRLAAAIGSTVLALSMNLTPSFGLLAGLSPVWRGAGPGKIATMLIESANAAPVILFDEIEKIVVANAHDRPLDVLHSLWEPENAEAFRDKYCDMAFNASHIISFATANSTVGISPSLLDRLLVLDIKPPTREQRRAIAAQAYAAAVIKAGGAVAGGFMHTNLPDDILDELAASTPRRITRLIGLALPIAVAAGRSAITSADIIAAAALLDSAKVKESLGIGFIRREG